MKVRLFTLPASHPCWAARLMLDRKGIAYSRTDLMPVIARPVLRAAGFPGVTVPAMLVDGRRVQTTRAIALELDRLVPDPPLFPLEPTDRAAADEAERWGDEVLQPVPRRLIWNMMRRDHSPARSYLEDARLGLPVPLAAAGIAPIALLAARANEATDENVLADLRALPGMLDHVDGLIAAGVIGGEQPNVADFQIATSIAILLTLDDLRPAIAGRPAEALAGRLLPDYPGHAPPVLPVEWLEPLSSRV